MPITWHYVISCFSDSRLETRINTWAGWQIWGKSVEDGSNLIRPLRTCKERTKRGVWLSRGTEALVNCPHRTLLRLMVR
jgi:hypothetical protein